MLRYLHNIALQKYTIGSLKLFQDCHVQVYLVILVLLFYKDCRRTTPLFKVNPPGYSSPVYQQMHLSQSHTSTCWLHSHGDVPPSLLKLSSYWTAGGVSGASVEHLVISHRRGSRWSCFQRTDYTAMRTKGKNKGNIPVFSSNPVGFIRL